MESYKRLSRKNKQLYLTLKQIEDAQLSPSEKQAEVKKLKNRLAADKCRRKTLQKIHDLEQQVADLIEAEDRLEMENAAQKEEISSLKKQLLFNGLVPSETVGVNNSKMVGNNLSENFNYQIGPHFQVSPSFLSPCVPLSQLNQGSQLTNINLANHNLAYSQNVIGNINPHFQVSPSLLSPCVQLSQLSPSLQLERCSSANSPLKSSIASPEPDFFNLPSSVYSVRDVKDESSDKLEFLPPKAKQRKIKKLDLPNIALKTDNLLTPLVPRRSPRLNIDESKENKPLLQWSASPLTRSAKRKNKDTSLFFFK